jgi:hypothetical protein
VGREELGDLFSSDFRRVDPFHTDLLSAPLRWLLERKDSDAYRTECVGSGSTCSAATTSLPASS